ncbi:hypothetical protein HDU67_007038, partial [Dinochytrium kinnereticum]
MKAFVQMLYLWMGVFTACMLPAVTAVGLMDDFVGNVTLERCLPLTTLSLGWEDVKNFTGQKRTILLEQDAWASSRLSISLVQLILTEVMGYKVEMLEFGGGQSSGRRLANTGVVDFAVELWPSSATVWYTVLVRQNRSVVDHGNIGYTGRVGLYVPTYLVENNLEYTLDFWRFLQNPRAIAMFPKPGTAPHVLDASGAPLCDGVPMGCRNNTYAPSWYSPSLRDNFVELLHVIPGYSQYIFERLIDGLGLNMTIKYLGDSLEGYLSSLYERRLPFIFYYWKPTTFLATHNFSRITFPDDSTGNFFKFQT